MQTQTDTMSGTQEQLQAFSKSILEKMAELQTNLQTLAQMNANMMTLIDSAGKQSSPETTPDQPTPVNSEQTRLRIEKLDRVLQKFQSRIAQEYAAYNEADHLKMLKYTEAYNQKSIRVESLKNEIKALIDNIGPLGFSYNTTPLVTTYKTFDKRTRRNVDVSKSYNIVTSLNEIWHRYIAQNGKWDTRNPVNPRPHDLFNNICKSKTMFGNSLEAHSYLLSIAAKYYNWLDAVCDMNNSADSYASITRRHRNPQRLLLVSEYFNSSSPPNPDAKIKWGFSNLDKRLIEKCERNPTLLPVFGHCDTFTFLENHTPRKLKQMKFSYNEIMGMLKYKPSTTDESRFVDVAHTCDDGSPALSLDASKAYEREHTYYSVYLDFTEQ